MYNWFNRPREVAVAPEGTKFSQPVQIPKSTTDIRRLAPKFPYEKLKQATNNWSNILGEGAFGKVYKGTLDDGSLVAIKVLDEPQEGGFEEELRTQSYFRHKNLVILMGFGSCPDGKKVLVYEYMDRGDVSQVLKSNPKSLHSTLRLSILTEIASAFSFLHQNEERVFHRDIKTSNILLNSSNVAKISDFGLALKVNHSYLNSDGKVCLDQPAGTPGYCDPTYIKDVGVSESTEVYSYGVVMIELLTGCSPAIVNEKGGIEYFSDVHKNDLRKLCEYIDYQNCQWDKQVAYDLGALALRCTQPNQQKRPKFKELVHLLRSLTERDKLERERRGEGKEKGEEREAGEKEREKIKLEWAKLKKEEEIKKIQLEMKKKEWENNFLLKEKKMMDIHQRNEAYIKQREQELLETISKQQELITAERNQLQLLIQQQQQIMRQSSLPQAQTPVHSIPQGPVPHTQAQTALSQSYPPLGPIAQASEHVVLQQVHGVNIQGHSLPGLSVSLAQTVAPLLNGGALGGYHGYANATQISAFNTAANEHLLSTPVAGSSHVPNLSYPPVQAAPAPIISTVAMTPTHGPLQGALGQPHGISSDGSMGMATPAPIPHVNANHPACSPKGVEGYYAGIPDTPVINGDRRIAVKQRKEKMKQVMTKIHEKFLHSNSSMAPVQAIETQNPQIAGSGQSRSLYALEEIFNQSCQIQPKATLEKKFEQIQIQSSAPVRQPIYRGGKPESPQTPVDGNLSSISTASWWEGDKAAGSGEGNVRRMVKVKKAQGKSAENNMMQSAMQEANDIVRALVRSAQEAGDMDYEMLGDGVERMQLD